MIQVIPEMFSLAIKLPHPRVPPGSESGWGPCLDRVLRPHHPHLSAPPIHRGFQMGEGQGFFFGGVKMNNIIEADPGPAMVIGEWLHDEHFGCL